MNWKFWKKKKENPNKKKKSKLREWVDAAVFAIVAATIIRMFFIEAYTIPTSSMENTMLINDYLFVSKIAYGPRLPMTPIALPLVHNEMPLVGGKSYSESVQWKYRRLPGLGDVKLYDVFVFNFPNNDTTMLQAPSNDYYHEVRKSTRPAVWSSNNMIWRPVDKRENYIKRCMGLPGNTIEIKEGIVFIDGKKAETFGHVKTDYEVKLIPGQRIAADFMMENDIVSQGVTADAIVLSMDEITSEKVKALPAVASVQIFAVPANQPGEGVSSVYPHNNKLFPWNQDNYGPVVIPQKGMKIDLNIDNIVMYRRVIETYEGNTFEIKGNDVFINGQVTKDYTFQMDYYWAMGDNRHNSLDSRFWGFVPEDHIVGKASFIWMSYGPGGGYKSGIRWNRLFRGVRSLEN